MVDNGESRQSLRWWRIDRRSMRLRWDFIRLLPKSSRPLTAALVVSLATRAVLPLFLMISVGRAASAVEAAVKNGAGSVAAHHLFVDLLVVGILFAIALATGPLLNPIADQLGLRVRALVFRRCMSAHLDPVSLSHLEDPELKDLVDRAQEPGSVGTRAAVRGMAARWATRLGGIAGIALLGWYQWWAGLLMLAVVVHAVRRMRIAHFEISRNLYSQSKTFRRSEYLRDLLLASGAEKETRLFGLGGWIIDRFSAEWHDAMESVWERRRRSAREMALGIGPAMGAIVIIDAMAIHDAFGGRIGLSELVIILQASFSALSATSISGDDTQAELGIATLEAVADLERAIASRSPRMTGTGSADGLPQREIRFENVRFRYPGTDREVLCGVDLEIPKGRSLAIVGENGAGKTTLIKLLARLYEPTTGEITVDGANLTALDPRSWQQRNSAIFQDFVHYPWSVRDNIGLHAGADQVALERAARISGALELIESLPRGWDTMLSRGFGGVDLSGGEWQRIALARALFAAEAGAGVLILDEPTAHLDVRQEAAFYEQFLELTGGYTTIVVSHRFSTVRRADRIAVIEHGRVVESGTHDELIALEGRYGRMFALQAARFVESGSSDA
jgi:ATP-binding cassette subfamily B protein